jgi:diguanylate cyclase (GGDEF)-like protein
MDNGNTGFFKLSFYRVSIPFVIFAALLAWVLEQYVEHGAGVFDDVAFLGIAAWFLIMGLLLWLRPGARRSLELALYAGTAVFFLARLLHAIYFLGPNDSFGNELAEFGFWIPAFLGLKYLWLGVDMGRRAAIAFLLQMAIISLPAMIIGDLTIHHVYGLSMLILASALSIFLYHVLIPTLIQYGAEKRAFQLLAVTDHLTGVANRRGLTEKLSEEIARSKRYEERFSVLLLDLDHFKQINDEYGHEMGDKILIEVTEILQEQRRQADTVGRWGGEEFLMILPHNNAQEAVEAASRIRKTIEDHEFPNALDVTVSIGVTEYREGESIEQLVARADTAMYQAKDKGRNRVVIAN